MKSCFSGPVQRSHCYWAPCPFLPVLPPSHLQTRSTAWSFPWSFCKKQSIILTSKKLLAIRFPKGLPEQGQCWMTQELQVFQGLFSRKLILPGIAAQRTPWLTKGVSGLQAASLCHSSYSYSSCVPCQSTLQQPLNPTGKYPSAIFSTACKSIVEMLQVEKPQVLTTGTGWLKVLLNGNVNC